jgi:ferredoxin-thioredoxin reductase catalytic subunit
MNLKDKMLELCEEAGFTPTENFEKIVAAKERFGIGLMCPCDRFNPNRFCISEQCKKDVEETGMCHCRCYRKDK